MEFQLIFRCFSGIADGHLTEQIHHAGQKSRTRFFRLLRLLHLGFLLAARDVDCDGSIEIVGDGRVVIANKKRVGIALKLKKLCFRKRLNEDGIQ